MSYMLNPGLSCRTSHGSGESHVPQTVLGVSQLQDPTRPWRSGGKQWEPVLQELLQVVV